MALRKKVSNVDIVSTHVVYVRLKMTFRSARCAERNIFFIDIREAIMKKFGVALLVAMLGAGLVLSCSDDSSKAKLGERCSEASDCDSGHCDEASNRCAMGTKNPVGGECGINADCESNRCDGTTKLCVDASTDDKKPVGGACKVDSDCQSNKCDADTKKCVDSSSTGDKKADGEACTADAECQSNTCDADTKKCITPESPKLPVDGSVCEASFEDSCIDNHAVTCGSDEDDGEGSAELVYSVKACDTGSQCVVDGGTAKCLEKCDTLDETKRACDGDSGADGETLKASFELTCKAFGEAKLWSVTKTVQCSQTCVVDSGLCEEEEPAVERKEDGAECTTDDECKSLRCAENEESKLVCTPKLALDVACTDSSDCDSGRCARESLEATEGVCKAKINLGEADVCLENTDCNSDNCILVGEQKLCKALGLKADGEGCSAGGECGSGFCNADSLCAVEIKPAVHFCKSAADCTEEGQVCGAEYTCVASAKKGISEECVADDECADGLKCGKSGKCDHKAIVDNAGDCASVSTTCDGQVLVTCDEDPWGTVDEDENVKLVYSTKACPKSDQVCHTVEGKASCYALCETLGGTKTLCEEEGSDNYYIYTCTEVDGLKVYVPGASQACSGSATCSGGICL